MVALSASKLVCPAIAWISPITSPMRLAAVASCDMVSTVRCASMTARLATSVEVAAWPAISPIEAASSSAELAAEVTFIEAAPTRSSAARDSADTASAAPLSAVEAVSSRSAAPRTLASASSMVFSNRAIMPATASVRRSRSRTDFSCVTESCSRSSALSRNTITVRAIAPISSRASVAGMSTEVSPVASRFIAPDSRCSGLVMPRPIRKLSSRPTPTIAMPMPMISSLVCACEAATRSAASVALRPADAMISSAAGSIWRVSAVMIAVERLILPAFAIHAANASV